MTHNIYKGKRGLCYTEVADFTDFQGIGNDPLYLRYDSVSNVIARRINPEYQHFVAAPEYVAQVDRIYWHVEAWGVQGPQPCPLSSLGGGERASFESILKETLAHYRKVVSLLSGDEKLILEGVIKYHDEARVYCLGQKVYLVGWGMNLDTSRHETVGEVIYPVGSPGPKKHRLTFDAGEHGQLDNKIDDRAWLKLPGTKIQPEELPKVTANKGWMFRGWRPSPSSPEGCYEVSGDVAFTAVYEKVPVEVPVPVYHHCFFKAGEHGRLEGRGDVSVLAGETLDSALIPAVTPKRGYTFKGWDVSPLDFVVSGDAVFTAVYEHTPWYKRWRWLKWLLWLLLLLLALSLLLFLLRGCKGCAGHHEENGVIPIDSIARDDGTVIDDNRPRKSPVIGDDGKLPADEAVVPPMRGDDGELPPIITQPGQPDVLAGRLLLFLEDENDNVDDLARDFKEAYSGDNYPIIGFDREVGMLVVGVPEEQRGQLREAIPQRLSGYRLIVVDEEVYSYSSRTINNDNMADAGWHLSAIHLKQGWQITRGSSDVCIAVVDDGIDPGHPMFQGRIKDAYNVFTQDNRLSTGMGHGTHTAGLAAGSADYYDQGAAGVAPECMIMPVQVFDNEQCPLSALVEGIMYSIRHDADVVNVSIGSGYTGLNELPVRDQRTIAETMFRNDAMLWAKVCRLAAEKNCIIVFAAGNDDIISSIPPKNRNESSIVVVAVDKRMYPTTFTNYGIGSDVSAPGKDIYSSYPTRTFKMMDGTSMAAPIVTGTVALMKSIKRDITPEQARNALYSTGADVYGWIPPMVLVDKALEATRDGRFERVERGGRSVPDSVDVHLHSGLLPQLPPDGEEKEPVVGAPQLPPDGGGTEPVTDYSDILRQIEELQRRIEYLRGLLPAN